jgi:predicted nucleic acid-binding protein
MNIAVTDACIFIDIHNLKLTPSFFSLPLEIHSTVDVLNELYDEHKQFLQAFVSVGKLILHSLSEKDRQVVSAGNFPSGLSEADKSAIYIAANMNAILLSTDKLVRQYAKRENIECHGMLWIFETLVDSDVLPAAHAAEKMTELISSNMMYQNNRELLEMAEKLVAKWNKF